MSLLRDQALLISSEQEAIRARCFHPSGSFDEFGKEEIERSIPHRFEQIVRRCPDRIAVKTKRHVLTYAELNATSNRVARAILNRCGERQEQIVLLFEHDAPMVAAILGVLKAGKIYVPLDPSYPLSRTTYILRDSQAGLMITNNKNLSLARELVQDAIPLMNMDNLHTSLSTENLSLSPSPDAVAYMLYTSGSTGQPKGVVQNHHNVLHDIMQYTNTLHICPEDRMTLLYSYSVHGAVRGILGALLNGATLYPLDIKEEGLANVANSLIHEEISIYHSVPTVFRNLVATLTGKEKFPSLRVIRFGGERVLARDVELYRKHFPDDCLLYTGMGSTETGHIRQYFLDKQSQVTAGVVPTGYPVEDKDILLLDDSGEEIGFNRVGEIAVKSRYLFPGYWRRPNLTQAKFLRDFGTQDKRIYLTGDLGRMLPDGCLYHLGRKDFQVKVRGYRIETAEIEMALLNLPLIKEAVVAASENEPGDQRLVAYLVPSNQPVPSISELRSFLKTKLPDYMVPSAFVFLDALPLTPNGKVDRRALPLPDGSRPELEGAFVAPRTPVEEVLAEIWAEVLKLEQIGVHDNLFELGGHSLLATQVISRVRDTFGMELPVRCLFEAPTVAGLAECIETALRAELTFEVLPLQPVPRDGDTPLSFAQERLWFLDQLEPSSSAYNIPAAFRLTGPLNVTALEQSLNGILHRHEALRTTFPTVDGQPIQVIAQKGTLTLDVVNLADLSVAEREAEAQRWVTREARRPFDLAQGPLFRATLLRLDKEDHVLLYSMHHIVSDGWSMGVFFRELAALYGAFSAGKPSPLAELPIQYADFALWQRRWLRGEILEKQLAYWKKQLADPPVLELPTDHPRPPVQTYRGATQSVALSKTLSEALKTLSQKEGVTLFMTLLAAFKALLYRYTGQDDIVVGSPIAGRNRTQLEGLIGFFINTLVLRTDLSGNPTFRGLLGRVKETALGAYAYQDLPFEKLVEELQPERDLSRTPLFQVFFNMINAGDDSAPELPGLTGEWLKLHEAASKFDLTLYATEKNGVLGFSLVYNPDLFEAATISRLLGHYHTLLEGVAADSRQPISSVPLLTEAERNQLTVRCNRVAPTNRFIEFKKEDIEQSLPARFEQLAKAYPHQTAVKTGKVQWSYTQLNRAADRIACTALRSYGPEEERIAVLFDHDAPMIAAILGTLKAGKTYVPLDPAYPKERLADVLEDSQARAVITNNRNVALAKALINGGLELMNVDDIEDPDLSDTPNLSVSPDRPAYILYTSGSTGQPKGVMQSHRNVLHHIRNYTNNLHLNSEDGLTLFSSYGFDAAVMDIFGALLNGAALHPMDLKEEERSALLARMVEEKITIYHSTPTVYRYLMGSLTGKEDLSAIRFVVLGGEEVRKGDVDLFQRRFTSKAIFVNGLGPTESTLALQYFINHETRISGNMVPVGYPVAATEVLLLNEAGEDAEIYGEIGIRSAHVALGYWRKPELTQAAFLPDPHGGAERIYRTGDMGHLLPDGSISFLGRKDFQVKIRGFRIELGEIETALAQHPTVREAVILAQEDTPGDKRLVAYVVSKPDLSPSTAGLCSFLKEKLPDYMIPSTFVMLDMLPLTPSGKVDRRALPVPDQSRPEQEVPFVPPHTPTERTIAEIWAEVLKLDKVGVHDNFFDLGGHSLLATQVVARIRRAFNLELPLRSLFENPTVAGQAEMILQRLAQRAAPDGTADILTRIEALSEEEAWRILSDKSA